MAKLTTMESLSKDLNTIEFLAKQTNDDGKCPFRIEYNSFMVSGATFLNLFIYIRKYNAQMSHFTAYFTPSNQPDIDLIIHVLKIIKGINHDD